MTRTKAVGIGLLLAAPALANFATMVGFAVFDHPIWLAYLGLTLVVEAVAIRYFFRLSWWKSAWLSFTANLATAIIGSFVICFGFWPVDMDNPQPFVWALIGLSVFAALSAITEAKVWSDFMKVRYRSTIRPSLITHLVGLVLGLLVLLLPPHPYAGVEYSYERLAIIDYSDVRGRLEKYVNDHGAFPSCKDGNQLRRLLSPDGRYLKRRVPEFSRFGAVTWRWPLEWNSEVSGKKPTQIFKRTWCARYQIGDSLRTIWYDPETEQIESVTTRVETE